MLQSVLNIFHKMNHINLKLREKLIFHASRYLGYKIRTIREEKKLTREIVVESTSISKNTLLRTECGLCCTINSSMRVLMEVAAYKSFDIDYKIWASMLTDMVIDVCEVPGMERYRKEIEASIILKMEKVLQEIEEERKHK